MEFTKFHFEHQSHTQRKLKRLGGSSIRSVPGTRGKAFQKKEESKINLLNERKTARDKRVTCRGGEMSGGERGLKWGLKSGGD